MSAGAEYLLLWQKHIDMFLWGIPVDGWGYLWMVGDTCGWLGIPVDGKGIPVDGWGYLLMVGDTCGWLGIPVDGWPCGQQSNEAFLLKYFEM
jgi:hypothetical protein